MSNVVRASEAETGVSEPTRGQRIRGSYALSLLWVAFGFAVMAGVSNMTALVFVDFVHRNPHRSQANAIEMMWLFTLIFGTVAFVGCFVVFGLPQVVQAMLHGQALRLPRPYSYLMLMACVPATAIVTWYCWEYLTPTDANLAINDGPDWKPYQHGITLRRYLGALAFQFPIALYSLIYCEPSLFRTSRRVLILLGLTAAIPIGVWYGHKIAESQYQFL